MNISKKIVCVALLLVFAAGCAQKQSDKVVANYYPQCHEPLAYLNNRHSGGTGGAVARGAIQGGVISGIAAAIYGAIAGGLRPAGILGSVAAGAAVGGLVSGVSNSQNYNREDEKHLAMYLDQVDGDITGMDLITAAATVSMQCYDREFKQLLVNMKNRDISPMSAQNRFTEIVAGRDEAAQLLKINPDNEALRNEFSHAVK